MCMVTSVLVVTVMRLEMGADRLSWHKNFCRCDPVFCPGGESCSCALTGMDENPTEFYCMYVWVAVIDSLAEAVAMSAMCT